jgi:hypothetical protein
MEVVRTQLEQNHTCIFVSFSGLKAKLADGARVVKEPLLRVLLDEQGELQEFGFVGKVTLLQSNFAAKKEGKPAPQLLKLKPPSLMNMEVAGEELECMITPMLSIVRRDTAQGYEYMLVHKEKEQATVRRKMKRKKAETMKVTEQLLFIVPKTGEKGNRKGQGKAVKRIMTRIARVDHKKKQNNIYVAREKLKDTPIRVLKMRLFEENAWLGTVSLHFLGPGDWEFPLPRAEPRALK